MERTGGIYLWICYLIITTYLPLTAMSVTHMMGIGPVTVSDAPQTTGVFISHKPTEGFYSNANVRLQCNNPDPGDLEWTFNMPSIVDIILDSSNQLKPITVYNDTTSVLEIIGIVEEDEGVYTCRSKVNNANQDSVSITVRPCRGDLCGVPKATTTAATTTNPPTTDETTTAKQSTAAPTTQAADATPASDPGAGDPCTGYTSVNGSYHFTKEQNEGEGLCFGSLQSASGWIKFLLGSDVAEIPVVPIKQDFCGTHFAFYANLLDDDMPSMNHTLRAQICSYLVGEVNQPCSNNKQVNIHNCNDEYYVYRFPEDPRTAELCANKNGADVCLKAPGEVVPPRYRSDIEETTTTLPVTTTTIDYGFPTKVTLTEEEVNGTLTIEYKMPEDVDADNCSGFWVAIDEPFRQMIADALNKYVNKPPEPEVLPTTAEPSTVAAPADTTTAAAAAVATTEVIAPPVATTTTTPVPTEPTDFVEKTQVLESEVSPVDSTYLDAPEGAQVSSNTDNDPDPGPTKRRAGPGISVGVDHPQHTKEVDTEVEETPANYTMDGVFYVFNTPQCVKGLIQIAFIVKSDSGATRTKRDASGGNVVSQDDLDNAVSDIGHDTHQQNTGLEYSQHYQGQPRDPSTTDEHISPISIWDAHMGLFIAVIVLLIICIIVIIIGILCVQCKGKGRRLRPEKTPLRAEEGHLPTTMESPISDEEITKGEAQMTEAPNPAYTPNGSGQHLTKRDEENGWMVPLEELSFEEREKPEVENTKL